MEISRHLVGQVITPDEVIRGGLRNVQADKRRGKIDTLTYVTNGAVVARKEIQDQEDETIGSLGPGSSFGEMEVLNGITWDQRLLIVAIQHSDIFFISGEVLRGILTSFPLEWDAMSQVFDERVVDFIKPEECSSLQSKIVAVSKNLVRSVENEKDQYPSRWRKRGLLAPCSRSSTGWWNKES